MAGGWVKLHRSILDWRWYQDANTKSLFIHLLITASSEDKPWRDIIVKRGQRIASYDSLAEELQLSRKQIRTALNHLKETGEVASKVASKYSIITILNYDRYQDKYCEDTLDDSGEGASRRANKGAGKGQAEGKQGAPSKEYEEVEECKEVKNTTPPTPSPEVPYEEIVKAYNDTCTLMPKVSRITDARRRSMKARWNDYGKGELQPFVALFRRASQSAFLNGENDRGWYADFDWLLNESNLTKVLEGKYDRAIRASPGKPVTQQEENSRILRRMYEDAIREEQANGDNEGSDDPTLKPDKRGFPEQQVPDNRQPGEFVGSLPRAL